MIKTAITQQLEALLPAKSSFAFNDSHQLDQIAENHKREAYSTSDAKLECFDTKERNHEGQ